MRLLNESWALGQQTDAAQPPLPENARGSTDPAPIVERNPYVHSTNIALGMEFPGPRLLRPQVQQMVASAQEFNCRLEMRVLNRTQRISIIGDSYNK